ncbi:MAG: hypothetical protein B0W54_15895 [Cellvibrio sp. 79]|nr:MAG: hypothetical protein B0W54_15895 [Cellvibrio sp. 79]
MVFIRNVLVLLVGVVVSAIVQAAVPSVPNFSGNFLSGPTVGVSWGSVAGSTSYQLERDGSVIYTGTQTTVTTLSDGNKTYVYRVKACNAEGCSSWSATYNVSTPTVPGTPSNFYAAISGGGVRLNWAPAFFANRYEIERGSNGVFTTAIGSVIGTSYDDLTVVGSTNYFYRIRACIDSSCSGWIGSNNSVTTPPDVAPASPASITPTIVGSTIKVDWSASSNVTKYELQRSGASGNIASGLITTYTDSPAVGTTYTYSVRACKNLACSAWVTSSSIRIPIIPVTPGFTGSFISGPTLGISWTSSANATSYELERDGSVVYSGNQTTITTPLPGAKTFAHRVRSCGADGCSSWSAVYNASTPSIPAAPANVSAVLSGPTIVITWAEQYFITRYEFQRNDSNVTLSIMGSTAAQDSNVVGAQNYTYKIRACIENNCSAWVSKSISTFFTPATPSNFSASISGGGVSLIWAPAFFSTRYEIQRTANGASAIPIGTATGTNYSDVAVVGSTVYAYIIRACIDTACSGWVGSSNSVTTPPDVAPAPPASIAPAIIGSSIKVDWSASSGATSYELQRSGTSGNIASGLFTTHTDSPTPGASYTYSVRSCKNVTCSAWVSSSPIALAPAVPGFTGSTVSGASLLVSWTASVGANRYVVKRNGAVLCDVSATSCGSSVGLVAATSYSHVIQACNGSICSAWSAPYSASTPTTPYSPSNMTAVIDGPAIKIGFSIMNPYFNTYEFKRNGSPINLTVDGGSANIFRDLTAQGAQNYTYEMRACIGANCTAWLSKAISTFFTPISPSIANIGTNSQTGAVNIAWSPSYFSTRYEIQRFKNGIADSNIWQVNSSSFSYSDLTALPTTAYTYGVRGCIDTACSAWAVSSSITTPAAVAPAAPVSISVVLNSGNINVNWAVSADANGYYLERNEQPLTSGAGTSYQDVAPPAGVEYTYRVKACKYTACSAWVSAAKIIVPPAPVINSGGINSPSSLIITWGAVASAIRYDIEKDGSIVSNANYTSIAYPDTNVNSGVTYSYRVRACAGSANTTCSNWSASKVLTMMKSPADVSVSLSGKNATIAWPSVPSATTYVVYRNGVSIASIQASVAPTMSFIDVLTVADTYNYKISACKDGYCSSVAGQVAGSVTVQPAPQTPTGLTAAISDANIYLTWNVGVDVAKYIVERNNSPLASNVTALGYVDSTAVGGASYTYRVKACNANELCSGWATTLLITMVGVPAAVDVLVLGSVIDIKWSDAPGAAFYDIKRRLISLTNGDPYLQTNYVDTAAVPGTLYVYWVRGCNQYGCGAQTGSVEIGLPASSSSSSSSSIPSSSPGSSSSSSSTAISGTVYEAENALISSATIATNQSGYSGAGFVNYTSASGSVEWTVTRSSAGRATLYFRYANGSGANKPMSVYVNNQLIATRNFTATSAWNAWGEESVDVALLNGSNKVRLAPVASSDLSLLDYLKVVNFVTTTTIFKYDKAGRLINVE